MGGEKGLGENVVVFVFFGVGWVDTSVWGREGE